MDERTTVQVPAPTPSASLVTHGTSGPEFQLPCTVTPLSGLCRQSCAVIRTVADHVSTPLTVQPSRFPTCMLGPFTVITIASALLLELVVRATLAPAASPGIVWVPTTALPAVPSVSTTSIFAVTSCPPTFCTVTTTGAVSPTVT